MELDASGLEKKWSQEMERNSILQIILLRIFQRVVCLMENYSLRGENFQKQFLSYEEKFRMMDGKVSFI